MAGLPKTIYRNAGQPEVAVPPVKNECAVYQHHIQSTGAALTGSAPFQTTEPNTEIYNDECAAPARTYTGKRVDIWPADRRTASRTFFEPPLSLVPEHAEIVAIGVHDFLPIHLAAWVSRGFVVVGIVAPRAEAGRPFLVRLSTEQRDYPSIEAKLETYDDNRAFGIIETPCSYHQGIRVSGLALVSRILDGEEL